MLTRSVYVRRLVPADGQEFDKDPAAYQGEWQSDEEGEIGEIVSETFLPVPIPQEQGGGVLMKPVVGVCWEKTKRPAISYEDLAFLENVDHLMEDDDEEIEEPLEEEEEEEESA